MKRFTETTKWDDPWFRKLSPTAKLVWMFIVDRCSAIGLIELDLDALSFFFGCKVKEEHVSELDTRLQHVEGGKLFIPKFIGFQYGTLSDTCPAHKPVIRASEQHQLLREGILYKYPSDRVSIPLRNGKEEEMERNGKAQELEMYSPASRVLLHLINELSGRKFRESSTSLEPINARLKEEGVTLDDCKRMVERQVKAWKGTRMEEYLRPETLFGKEKFEGYYASRDSAVIRADLKGVELSHSMRGHENP